MTWCTISSSPFYFGWRSLKKEEKGQAGSLVCNVNIEVSEVFIFDSTAQYIAHTVHHREVFRRHLKLKARILKHLWIYTANLFITDVKNVDGECEAECTRSGINKEYKTKLFFSLSKKIIFQLFFFFSAFLTLFSAVGRGWNPYWGDLLWVGTRNSHKTLELKVPHEHKAPSLRNELHCMLMGSGSQTY